MRFPPSFLEELRARLPVSEVVGRRVKLKKSGREFKGLSPFNKEKTPSFFVNDQKGAWFDFSSQKNGNIFDFLMQTEGVSFPEAVERLAAMAGVPLPQSNPQFEAIEAKRKSLYEIVELAAKFFEKNLASRDGAKARGYLADRGVKPTTQVEFRIGYALPERFALKEHLGSLGISVEDMVEAGLLIAGEDIPVPYDRFRDRVIIPIHDQRGRVVAFGGRVLNSDIQPKYLNSSETSLFHKGSIVFNFHRARQPAHEDGSVVVVEGYLDAIAIYQAGMKSVVASMGTAFTEEQIQTLWRLSSEPIVCFDADRAGIAAAHRSIDRILPMLQVGKTFRFAFIQSGKDPDELIQSKGLEAFQEVLKASEPLWDVLWQREVATADIRTPDGMAALEHRLRNIIRTINDPIVNTSYVRTSRVELSELFWRETKSRRQELPADGLVRRELKIGNRNLKLPSRKLKLANPDLKIAKEGYRHELQKILMGTLVQYPEFLDSKHDKIERIVFTDALEEFRKALYLLLVEYPELDVQTIYSQLGDDYYKVLNDVHGDKTEKRVRGHRLFERFPVLAHDPDPSFVDECIDHFIHILEIEQMADDLNRLKVDRPPENEADEVAERLINLVRQLHLERERANNRDMALAEEATNYRRAQLGTLARMPEKTLLSA
jgi:DNA primase